MIESDDTSPIEWNKIYNKSDLPRGKIHFLLTTLSHIYYILMEPRLVKFILKVSPRKGCILEAGCGAGGKVFKLSRFVSASSLIIGVDFSSIALHQAKKQSKTSGNASNQDFLLGDIRNLPFRKSTFDFILSIGVIEHFRNPLRLLAEMKHVLKNKGKLLLSTPNRKMFKLSEFRVQKAINVCGHHDFYTPADLTNLLQKIRFSIIDARSKDFSFGVLMWYHDHSRIFARYKYLNHLMSIITRVLTLPLNFFFLESGCHSIVIAQKSFK